LRGLLSGARAPRRLWLVGAWTLALVPVCALTSCGTLRVSVELQTRAMPTATWQPVSGNIFADRIALLGYSLPTLDLPLDSEPVLRLYWNVTGDVPQPYAVGMRLVADNGVVVWSYGDRVAGRRAGRMTTEHHLGFSTKMLPGDYGLEIWLYDPDNGDYAPAVGPNRIPAEDRVRMAILHLTDPGMEVTSVPVLRTVVYTAVPRSTPTPRP